MNKSFSGANLSNIKEMNISAVLKTIYEKKGISRIDIAASTEMSCAFVTKVLTKLTEEGIVLESGNSANDRGRPKVSLEFNYEKYVMVGLRINASYVSSALCVSSGDLLCHYSIDIDKNGSGVDVYNKCVRVVKKALECCEDKKILGIGIAAPGPIPVEHDRVTALTRSNLKDFGDIMLKERLQREFGLPVTLLHDAHCGALNEYVFGEEERYRNIVFIASDNGIGAGIILDGKPYNGSGGLAGEISHMILGYDGRFATLNSMISYDEIKTKCNCGSFDEVVSRVGEGNEECCIFYDRILRYLSVAAANFVTTVSPQAIVISDKIALHPDRVSKVCNETLDEILPKEYRDSFELIVRPYSKHSVLRGACGAVLNRAFDEPSKYFLK